MSIIGKAYTAQDMRDAAKCLSCSEVSINFDKRDISRMLRQAADMMDRAERAIAANDESLKCKHKDWEAVRTTAKYILTGETK